MRVDKMKKLMSLLTLAVLVGVFVLSVPVLADGNTQPIVPGLAR